MGCVYQPFAGLLCVLLCVCLWGESAEGEANWLPAPHSLMIEEALDCVMTLWQQRGRDVNSPSACWQPRSSPRVFHHFILLNPATSSLSAFVPFSRKAHRLHVIPLVTGRAEASRGQDMENKLPRVCLFVVVLFKTISVFSSLVVSSTTDHVPHYQHEAQVVELNAPAPTFLIFYLEYKGSTLAFDLPLQ